MIADFLTYLLRLTERELLDREKRAAERRVKDANFRVRRFLTINRQVVYS
jgi:hypothetical protein